MTGPASRADGDDTAGAGDGADPPGAADARTDEPRTDAVDAADGPVGAPGRSRAAIAAVALCAATLVAAVVMSALWATAALGGDSARTVTVHGTAIKAENGGDSGAARQRDEATQAAAAAAIALTTVSMDDIDGSLDAMHQVTTGQLADQFAPGDARDDLASGLQRTGVSMSTVLNSVVLSSFDPDEDTATALAFVVRTQTLPEGQQRVLRQGIGLDMTNTDSGWKVSDFNTRFAGVGDANGDRTGADAGVGGPGVPGGQDEVPEDGGDGAGGSPGGGTPDAQNPAGS